MFIKFWLSIWLGSWLKVWQELTISVMHVWIGKGASRESTDGTQNAGKDELQAKAPVFVYTFEVYN